ALGKKPYQALLIGITLSVVVGAPPGVCIPRCGEAAMLALGKKPYQALLIGITLSVVVGAPPGVCIPRCG
ncbi:hypothetical protein C0Q16_29630, partial [Klebsiella pneumoniae]